MAKIMVNSGRQLLLTAFMLVLAYAAVTLGYSGAAAFFGIVALALGVVLYRKVQNERVRAKFGEYRIDL
ncbi:hypothetical protein K933_16112 [Candidatus Halobonum tyrrellensis G22]|uniref:Uncharacterized protein n=2 Tax=Candidatus Halobonum TaxID=1431544 RepID=V4HAH9_9EURY|nr:hypothetical protein K933_16112 [Candidatus Halobonum tyrrellensis G22]